MKIVIIKSRKWLRQRFHAQIVARNGKVLFWTENYHNIKDLDDTIQLVIDNIKQADIIYP